MKANAPVLDMALQPKQDTAIGPVAMEPNSIMQMIERLASNPQFDADKLAKLIDLQERVITHQAKADFDAAFPAMQAAIPTIPENGKTNNGTYALLEDIIERVRPILRDHGFSLSFRTEWPEPETVCVVGILTHASGHSRESRFQSAPDKSGNKNPTQALGSVVSYGQRYTVKDLLGIVTRHADDDGKAAHKAEPKVDEPAGFSRWFDDLAALADNGAPALRDAWPKAKPEYRDFATRYRIADLDKIRAKAKAVKP